VKLNGVKLHGKAQKRKELRFWKLESGVTARLKGRRNSGSGSRKAVSAE
jgi:hypothetical protein